jgi:hypothetical protein
MVSKIGKPLGEQHARLVAFDDRHQHRGRSYGANRRDRGDQVRIKNAGSRAPWLSGRYGDLGRERCGEEGRTDR